MLKSELPERTSERSPRNPLHRLVWPLLRLSEVAARWPKAALSLLIVLTITMALGIQWVSTDDALENFLRAPTEDYRIFERMRERFPTSDHDVFVTIEAQDIFTAANLQSLQELQFTLLLADSVKSVVSIFSLKEPLQGEGVPDPIIPDEIPEDPTELKRLETLLYQHPLSLDRLLAKRDTGGQLTLFLVGLDNQEVDRVGLAAAVATLKSDVLDVLGNSQLKVGVAGVPAMKAEVIEGTARDVVLFNAVGLLVGLVVCWLFFRDPQLVLLSNVPAFVTVIFCLGLFGWSGTEIDPLLNAVIPLVIVVTFNNAMHFLFAICRGLDDGKPKPAAIQQAIFEIGPACALTSITTSVALFSLLFSSSPLIRTFGAMAGASVLISLTLIVVIMPVFAVLFLRNGKRYLIGRGRSYGVHYLDKATSFLAKAVVIQPWGVAIAGVLLTGLFFFEYVQLEPRYRLSDMLPDQGQSATVTERMSDRLGGVFPLSVLLEWPEGVDATDPEVRSVLKQTHKIIQKHPDISKVSSLWDLQTWAESGRMEPDEAGAQLLQTIPDEIKSRFVNESNRSALISGYVDDLESKEIVRISQEIEAKLADLKAQHPEMHLSLTGLSHVAAIRSSDVISQLRVSMLGAVVIVILIIGVAFASVQTSALSTVPNLFALFATGAWLHYTNGGLDYATIVGLTVAFGLAVDDTIHVLNRYELETAKGVSAALAVDRTLRVIGTVLILTTVVLLAGLSVTQLSIVPPTRQFGMICILTLFFALIADLVILPALLLVSARSGRGARIRIDKRKTSPRVQISK